MCRSVPHTPAWRTAMSTSPGPADGFGTVATFRPGARVALRIACIRTREEGRGKGEASEDRARSPRPPDRKSTRLNSSHLVISYAVFCLKKKKNKKLY